MLCLCLFFRLDRIAHCPPWPPFEPIAARSCVSAGTTRACLPTAIPLGLDKKYPLVSALNLTLFYLYSDHITELNNTKPKQPFFFLKPPSSILLPGGGPVLRPKGVRLHYEVELGLVMGKTLRELDPRDEQGALDAIQSEWFPGHLAYSRSVSTNRRLPRFLLGYILAIDMTARNVQDEAKKKGLPWSIAKGFDTFLPISQEIAKSRIPNPHDAFLRFHLGPTERQADSTSLMLYRIPQQLAQISRVMTLGKGDIVLTGTPKGVGEVKAGDVMRASIEVDGKEIEEGRIEVEVKDREGRYEFKET